MTNSELDFFKIWKSHDHLYNYCLLYQNIHIFKTGTIDITIYYFMLHGATVCIWQIVEKNEWKKWMNKWMRNQIDYYSYWKFGWQVIRRVINCVILSTHCTQDGTLFVANDNWSEMRSTHSVEVINLCSLHQEVYIWFINILRMKFC